MVSKLEKIMKSILMVILVMSAFSTQAKNLEMACLGKAISKVNAHHTLAEGSAYAVKILHDGNFGASLLVGHSDETDPTDYLVVIDKSKDCKVISMTVADESGDVNQYSDEESALLVTAEKTYQKELVVKGLQLMKAIPASGYDTKLLCISGETVTARVPMTHWSKNDRKTMIGSLLKFPAKTSDGEPKIEISKNQKGILVEGSDQNGVRQVRGYVKNHMADFCLIEVKPVLE
jgi:hypothetical protein